MWIAELFAQVASVFDVFQDMFGFLPAEVKLMFFYTFGILMIFGLFFMFKR